MNNLKFFTTIMSSELKATADIIASLPNDQLGYRPHERSRSAYEIAEHIIAHAYDFSVILDNDKCDECLVYPFSNSEDGAEKLNRLWNDAIGKLEDYDINKWSNEMVELLVEGKVFGSMPRTNMMWFFLLDIIHHRGQLSSYIRPMGGKNPAVYGYSADTI
jgi:uncharacterized damage-inducible protein DinB